MEKIRRRCAARPAPCAEPLPAASAAPKSARPPRLSPARDLTRACRSEFVEKSPRPLAGPGGAAYTGPHPPTETGTGPAGAGPLSPRASSEETTMTRRLVFGAALLALAAALLPLRPSGAADDASK